MRSSPKRICGFITPDDARNLPGGKIVQMTGDRCRADVKGDPNRPIEKAWPHPGHRGAVVNRHRHGPLTLAQRLLEIDDDTMVGAQAGQAPLGFERLHDSAEV